MRKQLRKQADAVAQAKDDAALEIDLNATMKLAKVPNSAKQRKPGPATENQTNGHDRVDAAFVDDDPGEDGNLPEASVSRRYRVPAAFEQRELVARAFAGDNVVEVSASKMTLKWSDSHLRSLLPRRVVKWRLMRQRQSTRRFRAG